MKQDIRRSAGKRGARCAAVVAACLALAATGCSGSSGGGPADPPPDPVADGCAPYAWYVDGAVPREDGAAWVGALVEQVDVAGDLAVAVGRSSGLRVLDVTDPAAPRLVGAAHLPVAVDVSLDGDLAAVAEGDRGVSLWSVADPAQPRLLARVLVTGAGESSSYTDAVLLGGGRLFVAGFHRQVVAFDVSDPARPRETGRGELDRPGALALVGDKLVAGGRAVYAVDTQGRLHLVQGLNQGAADDLLAVDGRLHAAVAAGLVTYDLTDPATVRFANVEYLSRARALASVDGVVWVASGAPYARLRGYVFDGQDSPQSGADIGLTGFTGVYGLAAAGSTLLAGDRWLRTIDVGNPRAPQVASAPDEPAYPQEMAAGGGWIAVADGPLVSCYPASGAVSLAPAATFDVGASVLGLAATGQRIYAARNAAGLAVIAPDQAAGPDLRQTATWFGAIAASDSLLASSYGGVLRLFTLADPDRPEAAGSIDFETHIRALAVDGDRVVVSLATDHLVLVDASDPAAPTVIAHDVGQEGTPESAAVAWADSFGLDYLSGGTLRVVHRAGDGLLGPLAMLTIPGEARGLALDGGIGYLLSGDSWSGTSYLTAIDLTVPAAPVLLGRAVCSDAALLRIAAAGGRIHTLATGGLLRWWPDCRALD